MDIYKNHTHSICARLQSRLADGENSPPLLRSGLKNSKTHHTIKCRIQNKVSREYTQPNPVQVSKYFNDADAAQKKIKTKKTKQNLTKYCARCFFTREITRIV